MKSIITSNIALGRLLSDNMKRSYQGTSGPPIT